MSAADGKLPLAVVDHDNHGTDGGGARRSRQVQDVVAVCGFSIASTDRNKRLPGIVNWLLGFWFIVFCRSRVALRLSAFRRVGQRFRQVDKALQSRPDVLIWESTFSHVPLMAAKRRGCAVVAFPHNIEGLGDERVSYSDGSRQKRLALEMKYLRLADVVVAISRSDQWLMAQFGVQAVWLPYYPEDAVFARQRVIRERRQQTPPEQRLLVFGSAFYPPIGAGMRAAVGMLQAVCADTPHQIDVAGYGSERLAEAFSGPQTTVHGSLSNSDLDDLLARCQAIVVVQHEGSGAVTRIVESLVAGIPVLANPVAARDVWDAPGVHVFADEHDLESLIAQLPIAAPPEPAPPVRQIEACHRQMRAAVARRLPA